MSTDNFTVDLQSLAIRISRGENLPVLPQVVSMVLKLATDPDASPRAFERVIERDAAITAKVLRAANSAFYGGHSVPTIGRAISVLGLNAIRSMLMSVAYQSMSHGKSTSVLFSKVELWRHSLAVATAARIMGKMRTPLKAEELYGAGMMHDVGMLVLERHCPQAFDAAIRCARERGIPLHWAEQQMLGFDHTEIGALLAEKWGLPEIVADAIRNHHSPAASNEHRETTAFISAADTLAHEAGFRNNAPHMTPDYDMVAMEVIDMPAEQLAVIRTVVQQEVSKAQDSFQLAA